MRIPSLNKRVAISLVLIGHIFIYSVRKACTRGKIFAIDKYLFRGHIAQR